MIRMVATALAVGFALMFGGAQAQEIDSKIALGGQLYDHWPSLVKGDVPKETHPAYPKDSKKKGHSTWRCKECHGWDYKGAEGAYGPGSGSFTGIKGIRALDGADPAKVVAILRDKTHALPPTLLSDAEVQALALFVAKGQVDMDKIIDPKTKAVKGDKARGAAYYNTICVKCHDLDGKKPKEMPESLGTLASRVPWEVLHKIRNSDPAPEMPAFRTLPLEFQADVLAYAQTLPKER